MGAPKEVIEKVLKDTGIDSKRRAETLSLEEFAAVSEELKNSGY